ncbi:hypothetical protein D3C73_1500600 [compost metagenome]
MAEADAENGQLALERVNQLQADPRFVRGARPGREQDAVRLKLFDAREGDLVIPANLYGLAELAQILNQVVGERIEIVDDQDHGCHSS